MQARRPFAVYGRNTFYTPNVGATSRPTFGNRAATITSSLAPYVFAATVVAIAMIVGGFLFWGWNRHDISHLESDTSSLNKKIKYLNNTFHSGLPLSPIYVNTTGNDANNGTIDFPVLTFYRASNLSLSIPNPTIIFSEGEFNLDPVPILDLEEDYYFSGATLIGATELVYQGLVVNSTQFSNPRLISLTINYNDVNFATDSLKGYFIRYERSLGLIVHSPIISNENTFTVSVGDTGNALPTIVDIVKLKTSITWSGGSIPFGGPSKNAWTALNVSFSGLLNTGGTGGDVSILRCLIETSGSLVGAMQPTRAGSLTVDSSILNVFQFSGFTTGLLRFRRVIVLEKNVGFSVTSKSLVLENGFYFTTQARLTIRESRGAVSGLYMGPGTRLVIENSRVTIDTMLMESSSSVPLRISELSDVTLGGTGAGDKIVVMYNNSNFDLMSISGSSNVKIKNGPTSFERAASSTGGFIICRDSFIDINSNDLTFLGESAYIMTSTFCTVTVRSSNINIDQNSDGVGARFISTNSNLEIIDSEIIITNVSKAIEISGGRLIFSDSLINVSSNDAAAISLSDSTFSTVDETTIFNLETNDTVEAALEVSSNSFINFKGTSNIVSMFGTCMRASYFSKIIQEASASTTLQCAIREMEFLEESSGILDSASTLTVLGPAFNTTIGAIVVATPVLLGAPNTRFTDLSAAPNDQGCSVRVN